MCSPPLFSEIGWPAKTAEVNVRIKTLGPRQGTPWHLHTVVDDDVFCLEGELEVGLRDPPESVRLAPGRHMKSWNSSHGTRGCGQVALKATGGAGLFYCFAAN